MNEKYKKIIKYFSLISSLSMLSFSALPSSTERVKAEANSSSEKQDPSSNTIKKLVELLTQLFGGSSDKSSRLSGSQSHPSNDGPGPGNDVGKVQPDQSNRSGTEDNKDNTSDGKTLLAAIYATPSYNQEKGKDRANQSIKDASDILSRQIGFKVKMVSYQTLGDNITTSAESPAGLQRFKKVPKKSSPRVHLRICFAKGNNNSVSGYSDDGGDPNRLPYHTIFAPGGGSGGAVLAHEIGHTLGLGHVENTTNLMNHNHRSGPMASKMLPSQKTKAKKAAERFVNKIK
ncbi:hypothetical protein [Pasteuria penetrans]|uniref:hypothetical protein n=1 Tax=Pasteuria penetrans TaxID=86005 RepID=UPI000FC1D553|nr:hypothetical protein [Pasteuria penetrans]